MDDLICGYSLDDMQKGIVLDDSKYLLVVAGAGSGKTLTILGKINYLIKYRSVKEEEILCISFTNKACDSLRSKIKGMGYDVFVYTFHKLSLDILGSHGFDFDICEGTLLEDVIDKFFNVDVLEYPFIMKRIMNYFDFLYRWDVVKCYQQFLRDCFYKIELLKRNVTTFLRLFKCNGFVLDDFNLFLKKIRSKKYGKFKDNKIFLMICVNVYIKYMDILRDNNMVDFDDMILRATDVVHDKGLKSKIKYVIIDEYQDTSYIRFCLIKEIVNSTLCNLLVVGDDFQSIYRFTGCNLSLFIDFKDYFDNSKVMKIENTYRNSQELIDLAGCFIMKNDCQIKKMLVSEKHFADPVRIVYYEKIKDDFKELIVNVYEEFGGPIMILGRNNSDINMVLDDELVLDEERVIFLRNKDIDMYYMTVHKAKGLEENVVIVINLNDDYLGFPSKIQDSRVFRLVSDYSFEYPFDEERRIFYVAITRTKSCCFLFSSKKRPSLFVLEMEKIMKAKKKN